MLTPFHRAFRGRCVCDCSSAVKMRCWALVQEVVAKLTLRTLRSTKVRLLQTWAAVTERQKQLSRPINRLTTVLKAALTRSAGSSGSQGASCGLLVLQASLVMNPWDELIKRIQQRCSSVICRQPDPTQHVLCNKQGSAEASPMRKLRLFPHAEDDGLTSDGFVCIRNWPCAARLDFEMPWSGLHTL